MPDLVLGTAQLRGTYGAVGRPATRRTDRDAEAFLVRAVELGFTAIDTAPAYDDAEEIIGRVVPTDAAGVHTKIDPSVDPATSVARSLTRLHRDRIDVVYFHDSQIAMRDPGHLVGAADALGDQVGRLGASVYESAELVATLDDARFRVAQVPMSILDRRIDDALLERAASAGAWIMARSVFLQGTILAAPADLPAHLRALAPYVDAVHTLAREVEMSVAALALAWVRQQPGVAGVVVGAQNAEELAELATAWATQSLDDAVLARCRALPQPPDELCDPRRWPR